MLGLQCNMCLSVCCMLLLNKADFYSKRKMNVKSLGEVGISTALEMAQNTKPRGGALPLCYIYHQSCFNFETEIH